MNMWHELWRLLTVESALDIMCLLMVACAVILFIAYLVED